MNERAEQSAPHAHLFNDYSGLNLKLSGSLNPAQITGGLIGRD